MIYKIVSIVVPPLITLAYNRCVSEVKTDCKINVPIPFSALIVFMCLSMGVIPLALYCLCLFIMFSFAIAEGYTNSTRKYGGLLLIGLSAIIAIVQYAFSSDLLNLHRVFNIV